MLRDTGAGRDPRWRGEPKWRKAAGAPPGRQGPLRPPKPGQREHRSASGGAPAAFPLPLSLRPCVVVMAAAASLSPEELLPRGGSGGAEELEDELEEDDDEEVAGRQAAGRGGPGRPGGRAVGVTPAGGRA